MRQVALASGLVRWNALNGPRVVHSVRHGLAIEREHLTRRHVVGVALQGIEPPIVVPDGASRSSGLWWRLLLLGGYLSNVVEHYSSFDIEPFYGLARWGL